MGITVSPHAEFEGTRVLISGGLGFIGSNLARRLVRLGADVTLVDSLAPEGGGTPLNIKDFRSKVTVNIADIRDTEAMRSCLEGKQYFFNLAGQTSHLGSMADPQNDLAINVTAQLAMLEECRRVSPRIKIVFASTRQVYGRPEYLPVNESHPIRPPDVNGINKFTGESYHLLYNKLYGIRASVLRLTNTYGAGMRVKDARQMFLGIWVRQLLEGQPLKVFGGTQLRDFSYVDDCVDAFLLAGASECANGKVYNVGSSEAISLKELAELMIGAGYGGTFEIGPLPAERTAIDIGDYYTDFSLIKNELGWTPAVDLRTGIKKTLAFYQQNLKEYLV
jgi:dTDP-glucose 4,6-dehydratase/UDP-glucose 4-epimerase